MEDGVKYIFKVLLKVPIIIVVCYLVMNIFFFFFIYFKCLGISYVVMQTAVENNYLPQRELKALCQYVDSINQIPFVGDPGHLVTPAGYEVIDQKPSAGVVIAQAGNGGSDNNVCIAYLNSAGNISYWGEGAYAKNIPAGATDSTIRKQYGNTVTVGVACNYHMMWPLTYKQTLAGGTVNGTDISRAGAGVGGYNRATGGFRSAAETTALRKSLSDKGMRSGTRQYDIILTYKVPGLHYYPDMINY